MQTNPLRGRLSSRIHRAERLTESASLRGRRLTSEPHASASTQPKESRQEEGERSLPGSAAVAGPRAPSAAVPQPCSAHLKESCAAAPFLLAKSVTGRAVGVASPVPWHVVAQQAGSVWGERRLLGGLRRVWWPGVCFGSSSQMQPAPQQQWTCPLPHLPSSQGLGVGWDVGIKIKMSQDQHLQINKL